MPVIEDRAEAIKELLEKADEPSRGAGSSIGSLIIACAHMLEIIEDQQQRIEHLEDVLQGQPERRRR